MIPHLTDPSVITPAVVLYNPDRQRVAVLHPHGPEAPNAALARRRLMAKGFAIEPPTVDLRAFASPDTPLHVLTRAQRIQGAV